MRVCDECGSDNVTAVRTPGGLIEECQLCGALAGDDAAVHRLLLDREARERGIDPVVYPLMVTLRKLTGLKVVAGAAGDPAAGVWPFVQMAPVGDGGWPAVESLCKSLALSAEGAKVHWVIEVEYQHRLLLVLKPRFHREVGKITAELVGLARADLERIRRNLKRDMGLSWWR